MKAIEKKNIIFKYGNGKNLYEGFTGKTTYDFLWDFPRKISIAMISGEYMEFTTEKQRADMSALPRHTVIARHDLITLVLSGFLWSPAAPE